MKRVLVEDDDGKIYQLLDHAPIEVCVISVGTRPTGVAYSRQQADRVIESIEDSYWRKVTAFPIRDLVLEHFSTRRGIWEELQNFEVGLSQPELERRTQKILKRIHDPQGDMPENWNPEMDR